MSETHTELMTCYAEHRVGGTAVVELHGEIDIHTAPEVRARLDAVTAGPHPDVVLDLRAMSFIDCTGLSVLCRARNRVLARRGRIRLVSDDDRFLRILRCVRLGRAFEVQPRLPVP
ncbi:hypothetical protein GCM10010145_21550 [Streptomyces ruber]|uniref:Anti-sigma factor antagonist n=2 Tax=Streptomyces TaxID=1883 RepID=A0A918BD77_9ACTN|nr:STAS domain-containing protein [Streptomyces ruber]GGQ51884.1 hypothetical protein GCM10010145_21550 [Streptomyces ruber]